MTAREAGPDGSELSARLGAGSEARKTWEPVNGIPATWFHGEGAYAQCGYCKRYTLDPKALSDRQPACECGEKHGWSGSFKAPGPNAQWAGGFLRAQVAPGVWANVPRTPEAPNVRANRRIAAPQLPE